MKVTIWLLSILSLALGATTYCFYKHRYDHGFKDGATRIERQAATAHHGEYVMDEYTGEIKFHFYKVHVNEDGEAEMKKSVSLDD